MPGEQRDVPPAPPRGLRGRVRRFVVEQDLIRPGDRVLVAVSGGPDSTCLLLALASLRRSLRFHLEAAHFDHRLRGRRAAAREAAFVRSLACTLEVPLHTGESDVRAHAHAHRQSIEQAARDLRYRFLAAAAQAAGCGSAAAGHTRDDQAETVLLHLVRGSGLRGLAAMAPTSPWPVPVTDPPRLLRPLLLLSRDETVACCRSAGLAPMDDPTNRSAAQTRSRIRHELLPALRRLNPRIDDALARLAENAAADVELLEELASRAIHMAKAGETQIERKAFRALPLALQRHAIRLAIARTCGDTRDVGARHVRALVRAAAGPAGAQLDLPRGIHVDVRRTAIVIATKPRTAAETLPTRPVPLRVPGTARIGGWTFEAELLARRPRSVTSTDLNVAIFDADVCGTTLQLRRRREGDRFQPLGMRGSKKLQDFFVDAHVPRHERDSVPLVVSERGIVWVAGYRPAEWAKVTGSTRRVLRIRTTHERS